jgi:D-serine deaminase-like pyridoxal phosphate-dependent protein
MKHMATSSLIEPLASDAAFRVAEAARLLTPALLIDRGRVQHNITTTLRLLGGDANRWRPHVKTAKLGYIMRMLVDAGVTQVKCATTLELTVACQAGARDVLVAYPLTGANAARVRQIAEQNRGVAVSVLVSGARFCGLHYYDGHLSKYGFGDRCAQAHPGYEHLMQIVDALAALGIEVPEVITAGTPAFPCSLSFPRFSNAPFVHRISPGTIVYCDATSLTQLPPDYGYLPAAVVVTRVVSHPAPGMITCDAGHKTVSADAGVPTCIVLGHPELEPLTPSEEHLPMRVAGGAPVPPIGELLFLVPRHVCPTVNNFDDAVIVSDGTLIAVEPVSARGRERPINL